MRRQADIPRNNYMGCNLVEKTVGVIGIGHVGTRVAELCKGLFHARMLAYDPYLSAEQMLDILDGKRPPRLLNPEVWPAYAARFERIVGFKPAG
jgi:phosphoglycerate dehydrogenase-like enzyme